MFNHYTKNLIPFPEMIPILNTDRRSCLARIYLGSNGTVNIPYICPCGQRPFQVEGLHYMSKKSSSILYSNVMWSNPYPVFKIWSDPDAGKTHPNQQPCFTFKLNYFSGLTLPHFELSGHFFK